MITITLEQNPHWEEGSNNPRWMAIAKGSGRNYVHSGDTQIQAIQGALGMLNELSTVASE